MTSGVPAWLDLGWASGSVPQDRRLRTWSLHEFITSGSRLEGALSIQSRGSLMISLIRIAAIMAMIAMITSITTRF